MADIKPEDIKETTETQSKAEADKLIGLGWVQIDTYKMNENLFYVLAWAKDSPPAR